MRGAVSRSAVRPAERFYRNEEVRPDRLTLERIMSWDDAELDSSRNVFEWLFPLDRPTLDEAHPPLLSDEEIERFKTDPVLRNGLLTSFLRALKMYGLRMNVTAQRIEKAPDFQRKSGWIYPRNFNYNRLTRILRSLRLLGMETEAQWLFAQLQELHASHFHYIGDAPMSRWKTAMGVR